MSLRLTRKERPQAKAYRAMLRRVRKRCEVPRTPSKPFRGRQVSAEHKAAIASLFCIAAAIRTGVEQGGVQVAQLRFSSAGAGARNPGLQRKPDDRFTLPLSPMEHRLQHSMGEAAYWTELGVDPHALARALWEVSPDREAMLERIRTEVVIARGRRVGMASGGSTPTAQTTADESLLMLTVPDQDG